jgi:hypothetical protein
MLELLGRRPQPASGDGPLLRCPPEQQNKTHTLFNFGLKKANDAAAALSKSFCECILAFVIIIHVLDKATLFIVLKLLKKITTQTKNWLNGHQFHSQLLFSYSNVLYTLYSAKHDFPNTLGMS